MDNFRNAAKAFIVRGNKLFMMKRRPNDPHKPGKLDIPGGRLELGEDPFEGLKREVKEELNSQVEIIMPLAVKHFVRVDGQKITLIMYWCNLLSDEVKLSEEHTEQKWMDIDELKDIPEFFHEAIGNYKKYIKHD
ncbi:MAG: NUDIX domain-containing protein [Candidatus Doudnabacteria bacterium]|nr:NUDIX domain-containing protein [Candidatus Doudnabacteria bacterium]